MKKQKCLIIHRIHEFERFSEGRAELDCKRYLMQLAQSGIGDDFMISHVESKLSRENNDEPQLEDVIMPVMSPTMMYGTNNLINMK